MNSTTQKPDSNPATAPIALTIAGSDSGGGAGIQADLKAFSALGVYGASVITAITAQNTVGVTAVHNIPDDVISAQIKAVLSDLDVRAIKIGMLSISSIIQNIANDLNTFSGPVVLDPVMVAKSGDLLLQQEAIETLRSTLIPAAALLTPNLPEAATLLEMKQAENDDEMRKQAQKILELGCDAVLMKGGHGAGQDCLDYLLTRDGLEKEWIAPRIETQNTHGTGCTLSSSIAAGLAKGLTLVDAIDQAHAYLHGAIKASDQLNIGAGHGPVHHFHQWWRA